MTQHFSGNIERKSAAKLNADAKPMFLVNGVSPLPFSSGRTGRIWREMDIQGMVKTQRHQKHSVLIINNSRLSRRCCSESFRLVLDIYYIYIWKQNVWIKETHDIISKVLTS